MRKLLNFVPLIVVILVFAPAMLIGRHAGDTPLTAADLAFALPALAYFGPLLLINKLTDGSLNLSRDDKRNYGLLAVALTGMLFIVWLLVLFSGGLPLAVEFSTTAAFIFAAYDLWRLITGSQTAGDLDRVVWLHFLVPACAAFISWVAPVICTQWPLTLNPIAVFFILRALLSAIDRPFVA